MTSHQTLINHPKLHVDLVRGAEGPTHDPYSYEEISVRVPGCEVMIHTGLACFIELNGEKFDIPIVKSVVDYDKNFAATAEFVLVSKIGYTREQLERMSRKAKSRCPKGGTHDIVSESGYPGEHFDVCLKCDRIVNNYFNSSAVE